MCLNLENSKWRMEDKCISAMHCSRRYFTLKPKKILFEIAMQYSIWFVLIASRSLRLKLLGDELISLLIDNIMYNNGQK